MEDNDLPGVPLKSLIGRGADVFIASELNAYRRELPHNSKAKRARRFRMVNPYYDEGEIVAPKGYVMVVDSSRFVRLLPEDTLVVQSL
ncbi:MAG: hypothetical protein KBA91_02540 [Candidatus Moranbacteria bacterium]|nr:hypothetical protein [Candidatus Moranbacteria bacterium]